MTTYKVEYSWKDPHGIEQTGSMGRFPSLIEAYLMVDTVAAMLDTIAEHWGAWVEEVEA